MSVALNGTSQYISLGDAVDIRSVAPILATLVVDSTGLPSATRGLYSQGNYSADTGHGAFLYGGPPKLVGNYLAPVATQENDGSSASVPADSGWYLVCLAIYTTGSAPNIVMSSKVQIYSYSSATWGAEENLGGVTGLSAATIQPPAAGQTTVIGANYIGGVGNFWPTRISWLAVFDNDGGGNVTQIKDTAIAAELIANGAWNLLDSACKLFIPFRGAAVDESGSGLDGTLVGSPSYSDAGPGELPPGGGSTQLPRSMHQYRLRRA